MCSFTKDPCGTCAEPCIGCQQRKSKSKGSKGPMNVAFLASSLQPGMPSVMTPAHPEGVQVGNGGKLLNRAGGLRNDKVPRLGLHGACAQQRPSN